MESKAHGDSKMDIISLAALVVLSGSPTHAKVEPSCCASKPAAKALAKVVQAEGYICPVTGQVLPCPSCCPANAKAEK